jgi:hypothetical protein
VLLRCRVVVGAAAVLAGVVLADAPQKPDAVDHEGTEDLDLASASRTAACAAALAGMPIE